MILNLQYALPQILLYMCPASKMVTKFANLIKKIILKMFKTMVFFFRKRLEQRHGCYC